MMHRNLLNCVLFCLVLQFSFAQCIQRFLNYSVNPGCDISQCEGGSSDSFLNLVHIEAVGPQDTVHYLWSTYKLPSILVARTSHGASVIIDWKKFLTFEPGSIQFSEEPECIVGVDLTELWEFTDPKDRADLAKANTVTALNLTNFSWHDVRQTLVHNDSFITATLLSSSSEKPFSINGTVKVVFSVSSEEIPTDEYPHLRFNSNSSQIRVFLDNLVPGQEKSRYALQMTAISKGSKEEWQHKVADTINDEYSPGVFSVHKLLYSSCTNTNTHCKSFLNWKPVAYIGVKPTVANSSDATISHLVSSNFTSFSSISSAYFGNIPDDLSKVVWNMTFGSSGDGFYEKTKYTSWSFMVGLGEPSMEKMSSLVIIVISVGLGAPLLIMLGGVIFLGYKRFRQNDDDVALIQG